MKGFVVPVHTYFSIHNWFTKKFNLKGTCKMSIIDCTYVRTYEKNIKILIIFIVTEIMLSISSNKDIQIFN